MEINNGPNLDLQGVNTGVDLVTEKGNGRLTKDTFVMVDDKTVSLEPVKNLT